MKQKHVNNSTHQKKMVPSEQTRYSKKAGRAVFMKMLLGLLSFTVVMTGCASFSGVENSKNIAKLKYGQSQSQVLSILGTPDSVLHPSSSQDQWIYEFKKQDKRGQNMFVEFNDGKLVKSGRLNGREIAAAEESRTSGVCTKRVKPDMQQEALCVK